MLVFTGWIQCTGVYLVIGRLAFVISPSASRSSTLRALRVLCVETSFSIWTTDIVAGDAGGPARECEAVDLGIVADVDGEIGMEVEQVHA